MDVAMDMGGELEYEARPEGAAEVEDTTGAAEVEVEGGPKAKRLKLSETIKEVTKTMPVCAPALRAVCNQQLAKIGVEVKASLTWVKRFLADLGYSYRKHLRRAQDTISEQESRLHSENLAQKVRYMQQVHEIPDELIWNIVLLPLGEHGWAHKKENAQTVTDTRLQTTCTVAIPFVN
eukprot:2138518-Amphidinium_carterae.1